MLRRRQDTRPIAQRAYQDGFRAARHDIADGKGPNADRHPHFRNPPVRPPAYEDYRHAFREGYQQAFRSGPEFHRHHLERLLRSLISPPE